MERGDADMIFISNNIWKFWIPYMYYLIESERRIYASSKYAIIGWDNGLSPDQRQASIRTNAWILVFGCFGTNFSEILIEICAFSFKKMLLEMPSGKHWLFYVRPQCVNTQALCSIKNILIILKYIVKTYVFLFHLNAKSSRSISKWWYIIA